MKNLTKMVFLGTCALTFAGAVTVGVVERDASYDRNKAQEASVQNKENPILQGVIKAESFYQRYKLTDNEDIRRDRHTTIVRLFSGEKVAVVSFDEEARISDLMYNVGDTVDVQRPSNYLGIDRIVNPIPEPKKVK